MKLTGQESFNLTHEYKHSMQKMCMHFSSTGSISSSRDSWQMQHVESHDEGKGARRLSTNLTATSATAAATLGLKLSGPATRRQHISAACSIRLEERCVLKGVLNSCVLVRVTQPTRLAMHTCIPTRFAIHPCIHLCISM